MLHRLFFVVFVVMLAPAFIATSIAQKTIRNFECKDAIKKSSVRWFLIDNIKSLKLPPKSNNIQLPKKYDVFSVTAANLTDYCISLRKNSGKLTLPVPDSTVQNGFRCISFSVQNSGTMPEALNAKYPEIVSLKGFAVGNHSNTIRFDYDGKLMNISVIWNGVNYLYVPYKSTNKTYYLLYNKVDGVISSRSRK